MGSNLDDGRRKMPRQVSFTVADDDTLDGALTAYAREWILIAAGELPKGKRTISALAEIVGTNRQRVARWLDALGIREKIADL